MQGNLSHISLTDLLLLVTSGKKSGVLKLARGKETVEVYLTDGKIVHATCPIGEGDKALLYPVTWGEGTFNLHPNGKPPVATINNTADEILDEVKAMTREWETILDVIPSGKAVFRIANLPEDNTGPITIPNVGWRVLSKKSPRSYAFPSPTSPRWFLACTKPVSPNRLDQSQNQLPISCRLRY